MYVRLVRFELLPERHAVAQTIADELVPLISSQQGCKSVSLFGNAQDGKYGIYVLWESLENAKAAALVIRPKLEAYLAANMKGIPEIDLFEVLSA